MANQNQNQQPRDNDCFAAPKTMETIRVSDGKDSYVIKIVRNGNNVHITKNSGY